MVRFFNLSFDFCVSSSSLVNVKYEFPKLTAKMAYSFGERERERESKRAREQESGMTCKRRERKVA